MSGVAKLASGDPSWLNLKTLDYYFETQPLPHFGAWFAHQLPEALLKAGVVFTFFAELIVPLFIFLPRPFRIFAAVLTIVMQGLIIATSNHNFVNLLTILLCLFLLDDPIVAKILPPRLRHKKVSDKMMPKKTGMFFLSLVGVVVLIASSSRFYYYWLSPDSPCPVFLQHTSMLVESYRQGNMYHIFAIMQTQRQELEIQGSNDGYNWFSYIFRYKPGPPDRRPPIILPHQPRLDWMMWFVPARDPGNLVWFDRFLHRLREGSPQVGALLKYNPFPDQPPRFLRVLAYRYRFTSCAERERTGDWWKREYLGLFPNVPPRHP
jgi:hypothetical protein